MNAPLARAFSSISSDVERRLFLEYGAVFATAATPPPVIRFRSNAEVEDFQQSLARQTSLFGAHSITLQRRAMDALIRAGSELANTGGQISARAADAGARSYDDTVALWTRNVTRGLEHWESLGRISAIQSEAIRAMSPVNQVELILDLEASEQTYFGTFFDRSILHSVAAPGASQHLSLLAFDVAEYARIEVEVVLAAHGWHRTVPNDLPHFTYLGQGRDRLNDLGLTRVTRQYENRSYDFWVPDVSSLG